MQREQKARQEQEEKLRKKEREENERRLEEMRKEQKARQEYEENLRKKDKQEAEERFKQTMDLLNREKQERQIQEENFRKREQEAEERRREREAEEWRLRQEREENLRRAERQEAEEMYRRRMEEAERERSNRERQEYMELLEEMKRQQEEAEQRIREANERNKGGDCFSLDTKVQLASGKFIEMAELKVGDYVCSNVSENGELEFSEVYLISHLGHYENPLKMIKIEFTNPDGQKSQIRMTNTHCIFREDLSMLYAQDVMPGETKILVLNEANKLIPVIVDDLTIEEETGFVSFYTRAGTVIANNTLCSCYDDCPPLQGLMDLVFAPIRLWTKVFPSNHRQKELHPYVRTLEIAYATLCNASNIGRRLLGLS